MSPFTNDEIHDGKKCKLNHIRRPPELERSPSLISPNKVEKHHGTAGKFTLNVQALDSP